MVRWVFKVWGAKGWLHVTAIESVEFENDIFVSSVGIFNIIASEHMEKMKDNALLGYSGYCHNEIDMSDSEGLKA